MKLGLVAPRYGVDVVGGIEHWLRLLCEHLVAMKGWEVRRLHHRRAVHGRLAATSWRPVTAGSEGSAVHRRHSISGRDPRSGELSVVIGRGPTVIPDAVARRFVELVGPVCPDVLDDAAGSGCDLVAVTPYLFWPAVHATGAPWDGG